MFRQLLRDGRTLFFGFGALLAFVVSAPATHAIGAPFHGASGLAPSFLSVTFVLLLEIGAVGAFLAGVRWLAVALLAVTTFANYAAGADFFAAAALPPTLAAWRAAGFGWAMCLIYAGSVPVLLGTFLHLAIERAALVLGRRPERVTVEGQIVELRRDLRAIGDALTLNALPAPQAQYPRPAEVTAPTSAHVAPDVPTCPQCGAARPRTWQANVARHGAWTCRACGVKHYKE